MTVPTAVDPTRIEGAVAVVTGASRRIGRQTALGLASHGADVVVTARSAKDEIEAVADEIRALGRKATVVMADVTSQDDVARLAETVRAEHGRADILVNNAAVRKQAPLLEMSFEEWKQINSVVLDGAFLTCQALLPLMIETGGGTVVNIGGMTGHTGAPNRAHVCTAKAGIVGFTKALTVEFADRGITANCLVPGHIGGARSASAGAAPAHGDGPLGRAGTVEEAAAMVVALCLPQAGYMTGQTVHVSGGLYMP
ncbi:SDR family NAD(P)-dependent oxidoreductase [Rhodovulum sp. 12E13]|uniref:SDR family NAD(P)-dependent oxidoreductase n=1 Tax=Rhodovulum sp. 12E13 TaxID=2203891 RepID=UPI000E14733B|nr:SDR family NAD(P)-dependent oxidoreductase [Rhodovulum sp. 12E13]RDC75312.1 SDR family NAD(P)-dependent oxidoreductase [Rhodovulum sp. 12E13]